MECIGAKLQVLEWSEHTSPTCFNTLFLWSKNPRVGRRKNTHCKGRRVSSSLTLRASTPASWGQALPLTGWGEPLSREDTVPHSWLQPQLLHLQPRPLTSMAAASTPRGETWLAPTSNPALPEKALGSWRSHGTLPHRKTSSKPKQVTVSSRFTDTGRARQNEKAEELLSIETAKSKPLKNKKTMKHK